VSVDEGTSEEVVFRKNIKGNAHEDQHFPFAYMVLFCHDVTTGK